MSRQFPDSNTIERAAQRINRMKPPKSKTAEVLSARVSLNIAMRTGKYEECIRYTDRIIDVFKKSPALIQGHTNFKLFVTAIYYGANFRTYLRQYKESDELMRLLESPLNVRQCDPGLYYEVKTLHELAMGVATYDLSRSRKAIGEYELLPAELHMQIPAIKQSEIFFTAAIASIIDGTPKDALRFVNIIRASKPTDIRNDLRQYIRVLFLIIHFDLNNLDVVETGIKAGRISFKRKNVLNPFYDAVFKLFSKMTRAKSIQKSEIAIREFLDHYSGEKAQFWASMNNYFNLRAWLTSKLEQRDFFKTLQEDEKL
ncbi:MAG TPA: hypothetical protein ENJ82_14525 [Bacteroidetes bacterium]|nr:hypothetical protein [Bacteroidota bacterium]